MPIDGGNGLAEACIPPLPVHATDYNFDIFIRAIRAYASMNPSPDGLVLTSIKGLMMKCVERPTDDLGTLFPPMVCVILQGSKHLTVGSRSAHLRVGDSFILSSSMPTSGAIIEASKRHPYIAVAVRIDLGLLAELIPEVDLESRTEEPSRSHCLFAGTADSFLIDSLFRLVMLLDHPRAAALLCTSIRRELHYWLLSGDHGAALRSLVRANSRSGRLDNAICRLRTQYATRLSVKELAQAAGMSPTSFHVNFKQLTGKSPGQYQKQMRLVEARRILLKQSASATSAAFLVGYESVSQFTRDYTRMFGLPPKRDALAARARLILHNSDTPDNVLGPS